MSMQQPEPRLVLLLALTLCFLSPPRRIVSAQDPAADTRAQTATPAATASGEQNTASPTPAPAQDLEGVFQKCGQDCLYLALRNIGLADLTWAQVDELLGKAPTCTMEQMQLAAESVGAYTAALTLRGDEFFRLRRLARSGSRFGILVYLKPGPRFGVGHFAFLPWVAESDFYYIEPSHGSVHAPYEAVTEDATFLLLVISQDPVDLRALQRPAMQSLAGPTSVVLGAAVLSVLTFSVLSRRKNKNLPPLADH